MEQGFVVFINKSEPKSRHFKKLKTRLEKNQYLLRGNAGVSEWFDTKKKKEFFRPTLNDITVARNPDISKQYSNRTLALKEAEIIRKSIVQWVKANEGGGE